MVTNQESKDAVAQKTFFLQRKRPRMWKGKNWKLHHDNAPAHFAHKVFHLKQYGTWVTASILS